MPRLASLRRLSVPCAQGAVRLCPKRAARRSPERAAGPSPTAIPSVDPEREHVKKLVFGPLIALGLLVVYILFEVQILSFLLGSVNNGLLASYGMWRLRVLERKDKVLDCMRSPVPKTRLFALWNAMEAGWHEVIPGVADSLRSKDLELFRAANEAVLRFKSPSFIAPLKENLKRFTTQEQIPDRILTIRSLGAIDDDEAARALLAVIDEIKKMKKGYLFNAVSSAAEAALCLQGRPVAKTFLVQTMIRGVDTTNRANAVRALKKLGAVEAAPQIAKLATMNVDERIVLACIDALATIGSPAELPVLQKLAAKGSKKVRAAAKEAIKSLTL